MEMSYEQKLWQEGFKSVVGLDEAGRGPLAGPVVAAATSFKVESYKVIKLPGLNDSKKLSPKKREELYESLTTYPGIVWGVGVVSEKVIDTINILQATKLAMKQALENMSADFLLIDGNFTLDISLPQQAVVKGDSKVFSIAAASIIAKVTRDRLMQEWHEKYPAYGFGKHKGYGSAGHIKSLYALGPCPIHRRSFEPVKSIAKTEVI